jgi:hypothetical protein
MTTVASIRLSDARAWTWLACSMYHYPASVLQGRTHKSIVCHSRYRFRVAFSSDTESYCYPLAPVSSPLIAPATALPPPTSPSPPPTASPDMSPLPPRTPVAVLGARSSFAIRTRTFSSSRGISRLQTYMLCVKVHGDKLQVTTLNVLCHHQIVSGRCAIIVNHVITATQSLPKRVATAY